MSRTIPIIIGELIDSRILYALVASVIAISISSSLIFSASQRVALASVLAASPDLLILDEPTRGLYYRLKKMLMGYLKNYQKKGGTVFLITHDIELVAEFVERVILLSEGKIVAAGDKHEVLSNSLHFSPQINRLIQPYSKFDVPSDILTIDELIMRF